jgi:ubiquitin carboxyl-terminal hydrolase 8
MPNGVPASAVPSGVSTPYSAAATPPPDKVEFPVTNSVSARMLDEYLQNPALKVLLIDVRPRNEFERETIKHPGDAIVCLEPTVLMRET